MGVGARRAACMCISIPPTSRACRTAPGWCSPRAPTRRAGSVYALENRIVISKTFPDLFRDMQVERLASFFNAYREFVLDLAEEKKGRAVFLTPGPYNEAYFEHAYIAHYLGLSLVEGQDLIVRDGQVLLKTLAGLERVAVIFRRLDSDFCDPLEFRAEFDARRSRSRRGRARGRRGARERARRQRRRIAGDERLSPQRGATAARARN